MRTRDESRFSYYRATEIINSLEFIERASCYQE